MIEVDKTVYGKNLIRLMRKRSMSVERLHEMTGISSNSITCYRQCRVYPTSQKIQIIAKALRFDAGEFFKDIDEDWDW